MKIRSVLWVISVSKTADKQGLGSVLVWLVLDKEKSVVVCLKYKSHFNYGKRLGQIFYFIYLFNFKDNLIIFALYCFVIFHICVIFLCFQLLVKVLFFKNVIVFVVAFCGIFSTCGICCCCYCPTFLLGL